MKNLLTTKQVQDLLNIDRTTIYRMLKDGRLSGVKVGSQWRFPREEIEALVSGKSTPAGAAAAPASPPELSLEAVPLTCIQAVQDIFAEVVGIGAVTTMVDGEPLTEISNSCRYCDMILASQAGRAGCLASWQKLAEESTAGVQFSTCHAGLNFAGTHIALEKEETILLVAGQFYTQQSKPDKIAAGVNRLARQYDLDSGELAAAANTVPVLDERTQIHILKWLQQEAETLEEIINERWKLIRRFQQMTDLQVVTKPVQPSATEA